MRSLSKSRSISEKCSRMFEQRKLLQPKKRPNCLEEKHETTVFPFQINNEKVNVERDSKPDAPNSKKHISLMTKAKDQINSLFE